jgi:hypothetical protein
MAFDVRQVDLAKLNSMTMYPAILTYHTLGDKGVLQGTVQVPFSGRVVGTEKVDGTNSGWLDLLELIIVWAGEEFIAVSDQE